MATVYKNLSAYDPCDLPEASDMRVGIVVSEWNGDITEKLLEGARHTLQKQGAAQEHNITVFRVPGSFELVFGAQQVAKCGLVDAVIVLGCVIKGDTSHFDYICEGVANGIATLNATQNIPVIFGLLTVDNMQQAKARAGGKHGNKGDEAAVAAIKMISFFWRLKK